MLVFIVIYGLDWVATVPPTAALCREVFGANGTSSSAGSSPRTRSARRSRRRRGVIRDTTGNYNLAWFGAAALCAVAAAVSFGIRRAAPNRGLDAIRVERSEQLDVERSERLDVERSEQLDVERSEQLCLMSSGASS